MFPSVPGISSFPFVQQRHAHDQVDSDKTDQHGEIGKKAAEVTPFGKSAQADLLKVGCGEGAAEKAAG
jgi:hypothetical protein